MAWLPKTHGIRVDSSIMVSTWRHIRAILLLPFMATVVIPAGIIYDGDVDTLGLWELVPVTRFVLPSIGLLIVGLGLFLMVATISLFVFVGEGHPGIRLASSWSRESIAMYAIP